MKILKKWIFGRGEILEVEDFPEARKPMYKITVDFGSEIGIKKSSGQFTHHYKKEDVVLLMPTQKVPKGSKMM